MGKDNFTFSKTELRHIEQLLDKINQIPEEALDTVFAQEFPHQAHDAAVTIPCPSPHALYFHIQNYEEMKKISLPAGWKKQSERRRIQNLKSESERKVFEIIEWHDKIIEKVFDRRYEVEEVEYKYKQWLLSLYLTYPILCERYISFILCFHQVDGYNMLLTVDGVYPAIVERLRNKATYDEKKNRPALWDLADYAFQFIQSPKDVAKEVYKKYERYEKDAKKAQVANRANDIEDPTPGENTSLLQKFPKSPGVVSPQADVILPGDIGHLAAFADKPFLSSDYQPGDVLYDLACSHRLLRNRFSDISKKIKAIEASIYVEVPPKTWIAEKLTKLPIISAVENLVSGQRNVKTKILETHIGKLKKDLLELYNLVVDMAIELTLDDRVMNDFVFQLVGHTAKKLKKVISALKKVEHLPNNGEKTLALLDKFTIALMSYSVMRFYPLDKGMEKERMFEIGESWGLLKKFNIILWRGLQGASLTVFAAYVGSLIYAMRDVDTNFLSAAEMYGGEEMANAFFATATPGVLSNTNKIFDAIKQLLTIQYMMMPAASGSVAAMVYGAYLYLKKKHYDQFEYRLWNNEDDGPLRLIRGRLENLSDDFKPLREQVAMLINLNVQNDEPTNMLSPHRNSMISPPRSAKPFSPRRPDPRLNYSTAGQFPELTEDMVRQMVQTREGAAALTVLLQQMYNLKQVQARAPRGVFNGESPIIPGSEMGGESGQLSKVQSHESLSSLGSAKNEKSRPASAERAASPSTAFWADQQTTPAFANLEVGHDDGTGLGFVFPDAASASANRSAESTPRSQLADSKLPPAGVTPFAVPSFSFNQSGSDQAAASIDDIQLLESPDGSSSSGASPSRVALPKKTQSGFNSLPRGTMATANAEPEFENVAASSLEADESSVIASVQLEESPVASSEGSSASSQAPSLESSPASSRKSSVASPDASRVFSSTASAVFAREPSIQSSPASSRKSSVASPDASRTFSSAASASFIEAPMLESSPESSPASSRKSSVVLPDASRGFSSAASAVFAREPSLESSPASSRKSSADSIEAPSLESSPKSSPASTPRSRR